MNMQTITEPLRLLPRLDDKPWGGTRLTSFGIDIGTAGNIGEAVMTANDATVDGGTYAGQTLGTVVATNPEGLLGPLGWQRSGKQAQFPLLIKLLDAEQWLSIQVHPSNALAPLGTMGKSEAWYVLSAEPDACVLAGLEEGVDMSDL